MAVCIEDLVELAITRGCGKSITELTESTRFAGLVARYSQHTRPTQAALVELLGEELIESAKACLPAAACDIAREWPQASAEGQKRTVA